MKKCRYCKSEIDQKAKVCPNCRKKQTNPLVKFVIAVLIIIVIIVACSNLGKEVEKEQQSRFTLTNDRGYADEYGIAYYIEGSVKNNTNTTYSYVQITFNSYDAEGNQVGSCVDNINNLEANGTWKIKAICLGDASTIASYKFVEFTSW